MTIFFATHGGGQMQGLSFIIHIYIYSTVGGVSPLQSDGMYLIIAYQKICKHPTHGTAPCIDLQNVITL